jgi:hypothetical protein
MVRAAGVQSEMEIAFAGLHQTQQQQALGAGHDKIGPAHPVPAGEGPISL